MCLSIAIAKLGVTRQSLEETITHQVTYAENLQNLGSFPTRNNIYLMDYDLEFFCSELGDLGE